jgi:hypothetical protein
MKFDPMNPAPPVTRIFIAYPRVISQMSAPT